MGVEGFEGFDRLKAFQGLRVQDSKSEILSIFCVMSSV